jgi:M6 family metalloprotease-like protein
VCTGETPEEADEESDTRYLRQTNRITPEHRNLLTGTLKNLVIPIIFSDHHHRPRPSREDLDLLMNHDGPHEIAPTGSVRDVYLNNSYGLLTIESTVVDWIQLPNSEAYYADGDSGTEKLFEALRFALQKLDDDGLVTFSDFDEDDDGMIDAITFFHR